jgi:sec-independent protein translocase protein TatA
MAPRATAVSESIAVTSWWTEDFMGSLSIWHWLIVGAVLLLVFGGRGKVSDLMGDVAKGIKAFKKGMSDDETAETSPKSDPMRTIDHQAAADIKRRAESESKV